MKFPFKRKKDQYKPSAQKTIRQRKVKRFLIKRLPFYVAYTAAVFAFLSAVTFAWFTKDLPTPSKIANRRANESTKIYDRTGTILLYETGEQKRTVVENDQISSSLKDATVAIEDWDFYNHHGFSSRGIASALMSKVTGKSNRTRGGSTITQQYVKNALLSSNRSIVRKIKELILAVELEIMFNKNEILTMYLNEIPYGNGTAGAEAAARVYYGKTAKDLTLAESATLAAIPQAPTYYSPYGTHVDELIQRRNHVLDRMVETGRAKQEEVEAAKKEDTTTIGKSLHPRRDTILAPHFAMYVIEQIADEFGEEKIQKEGLNIISTLDYGKQKIAEESVNNGADKFSRYGATNAALVAVDPRTGQVLSMIGSKDYFDTKIDGNVNVAASARQPGSSFKPIAYATAFKKKEYSPSKILFDLETDFGNYTPQNYNMHFNGPVTMRQALSNSLNIPAVKVLSLAGIDNVLKTADDLGISTLTQRDRYGLSLVLGAGEVKPVEMAGAFAVFANEGTKHETKSVLKVTDSHGKVLYEYKPEQDFGNKVLDPQIAYEISDILSDNDARSLIFGPRSALYFPDRRVAAKTGTTSEFKDAWTIGFTPSISVAVWVGNADGTKMRTGADGSVIAAPIFHSFIEKALSGTQAEQFTRPEGIVEMEVEKFSNKLPSEYSREKTRDIFASWQAPSDQDDVNTSVRLCRGTNKLAANNIPNEFIDTRVTTVIHSERPDNPNWERPVRGWAEGNGFASFSPESTCTLKDLSATVSITSPQDGTNVSGEFNINASVLSPIDIDYVEFFIDNVPVGKDSEAPFSVSYNTKNLSTGQIHRLQAIAADKGGNTNRSEITISVGQDIAPPSINSVKATPANNNAVISWATSEETTSQIFYDTSSRGNIDNYTFATSRTQELAKNTSIAIGNLTPGTVYYYRVTSSDSHGNSAISEEKTFTTLP